MRLLQEHPRRREQVAGVELVCCDARELEDTSVIMVMADDCLASHLDAYVCLQEIPNACPHKSCVCGFLHFVTLIEKSLADHGFWEGAHL